MLSDSLGWLHWLRAIRRRKTGIHRQVVPRLQDAVLIVQQIDERKKDVCLDVPGRERSDEPVFWRSRQAAEIRHGSSAPGWKIYLPFQY